MPIQKRLAQLPWGSLAAELNQKGWATTGSLLSADECQRLIASYDDDGLFRSTVVMSRHGYGRGEYRYFDRPLPPLVSALREALYGHLLAVANGWRAASHSRHSIRNSSPAVTRPGRHGRLRCSSVMGWATIIAFTRTFMAIGSSRCRRHSCSPTPASSRAANSSSPSSARACSRESRWLS